MPPPAIATRDDGVVDARSGDADEQQRGHRLDDVDAAARRELARFCDLRAAGAAAPRGRRRCGRPRAKATRRRARRRTVVPRDALVAGRSPRRGARHPRRPLPPVWRAGDRPRSLAVGAARAGRGCGRTLRRRDPAGVGRRARPRRRRRPVGHFAPRSGGGQLLRTLPGQHAVRDEPGTCEQTLALQVTSESPDEMALCTHATVLRPAFDEGSFDQPITQQPARRRR